MTKHFPPLLRDYHLEAQSGGISGIRVMEAFGERESIQTTSEGEDLWRGNELSNTPSALASHILVPTPADAGEQMTVISESAQDASGGTGASTINIVYIDASGDEQTTPLTLNGQTAVDVTPSDVRFVNEIYITALGSGNVTGVTAGNIRIYKKSAATLVYSMIQAGGNMSLVPHRMVPLGKSLYLQEWAPSEKSGAKRAMVRLRADSTPASPPVRQAGVFLFKSTAMLDGSIGTLRLATCVPALSVVKASAWASVNGAEAAVHWWGYLVDD